MGNVCTCCNWGREGADSKTGKTKKLDKKDMWFENDSVPLVSARYGLDDIGSDEADGSLKRKVLIRSPRPTSTSTSIVDECPSRALRHSQQQDEQEEQHHTRSVKSASVDSSTYSRHSKTHHHHSRRDNDSDDRPRHSRRTARSSSLEVQDSTHEMRSPSSPAISPRVTSQSQDAASFADDEVESVDSFPGSTRSHRSSSASSSPKASSRSGSPQKKTRYGRKHYRANANRK